MVNPFAAEKFGVNVAGGQFVVESYPYGGTAAMKSSAQSSDLDAIAYLDSVVIPFLLASVTDVDGLEFRAYPKTAKARESWWRELPFAYPFSAESSIRYGNRPTASDQEDTMGKSDESDA